MVEQIPRREIRQAPQLHTAQATRTLPRPRWQLVGSVIASLVIAVVLWINRAWLGEAFGLVRSAHPLWLGSAFAMILLSYFVSSLVFRVGLRSFGQRVGSVRLWVTTIIAIVISQSIPAGGVGSYAFFVSAFKRRGVSSGQAALLAALEGLSYAGAMVLIGAFSVIYLLVNTLGGNGATVSVVGPLVAGSVAVSVLGGAAFVLTRSETTLSRWVTALAHTVQRVRGRPRTNERAGAIVAELVRGRTLVTTQRRTALFVVLVQIIALCGHSLALLFVLWSLGVNVGFGVALAAFGVALITSTFNVLPGGGGTVETVLVAVLLQFAVGAAAVPAAIVFRLLNFWALLPVAVSGYLWVMRSSTPQR